MTAMKKTILQHAILTALFGIGMFALMVACGNEAPGMSFTREMITRAVAFGIAVLCYQAGKWCAKRGLLTDTKNTSK